MSEPATHQKRTEGQEQEPNRSSAEEECCLPLCGPDTCGLPLTGEPGQEPQGRTGTPQAKVIKLTPAGAQRLFNGEDDEIYSREDLIEMQPDGSLKVTGSCSGTVWLVQKNEIAAIVEA